MNLYAKYILPRLIDLVMRSKADTAERARFVPRAAGTVLEVGAGSGLNIPFYGSKIERLYALDPSHDLWRLARRRVKNAPFPIEFLPCSAERIPLADSSVDAVVTTWSLCTIPNADTALKEMKRVLKADGHLIFVEHGRAPDPGVRVWQDRLNPVWKWVAGGCNLNRKIDELLVQAGLQFVEIERRYTEAPRVFGYLYTGVASR